MITASQVAFVKHNEYIYVTGTDSSLSFMYMILTSNCTSSSGCLKFYLFQTKLILVSKLVSISIFFLNHWHQLSFIPIFKSISSTAKSISKYCFFSLHLSLLPLDYWSNLSLQLWFWYLKSTTDPVKNLCWHYLKLKSDGKRSFSDL